MNSMMFAPEKNDDEEGASKWVNICRIIGNNLHVVVVF
jgi:hypothetical protein